MGTEPIDSDSADCEPQAADYCRQIERYLCQKNDGHLIRVVGPSFELVSRWAADGVPLKVAFRGIDRYVDRQSRKGPRRRPARIDFCEADVLDVFDEWRRAIGLAAMHVEPSGEGVADEAAHQRRGASLPAHLKRVILRLTNARATGAVGAEADAIIDRVSRELDAASASSHGLRGDAKRALVERLAALDAELLRTVRAALDDGQRDALGREAQTELARFRGGMSGDAYRRAHEAAIDALVRERFHLPTLMFD